MEFFKAKGGFRKQGGNTYNTASSKPLSDGKSSDGSGDENTGFKILYAIACISITFFIYWILITKVYKMPYFSLPNNDKKVLYINCGVMAVLLAIYIPVGITIFSGKEKEEEKEEETKVDVASANAK